jgi:hypothetical protein
MKPPGFIGEAGFMITGKELLKVGSITSTVLPFRVG